MIDDLSSIHHVSPIVSSVLIDGLGTLGLGAVIAHALLQRARKLREARTAEASAEVNPRLAPGPAVVFGRVEYAQGANVAVRVDIDQDGDESENSGVWSHKWTEKNRRVHVEPFYLRIDGDKRIRVEPTHEVFLVDDMDGLIRVDLTKRVKFAQLTSGERVYASGELVRAHDPEAIEGGGYRTSREARVLRPLHDQPMLLSSHPLGARYRDRARFYVGVARKLIIGALVFHAALCGFHLRRTIGQTVDATITKLDHYITRDDENDEVHHYRVWCRTTDDKVVSDQVDYRTFEKLKTNQIVPVRLLNGAFSRFSTIGPDVTVSNGAFFIVPLLLVCWVVYKYHEKTSRPWYEREVVDTGSGRLEETLASEREASAGRS